MIARVVRSGVVKATHEGAVDVVASDGELVAASGDIQRMGLLVGAARSQLAGPARPPVLGGGAPVGYLESILQLDR